MGYYMRFFMDDERPISIDGIQAALQEGDPAFRIIDGSALYHGDALLARVELNLRGSELGDQEIAEFLDQIEASDDPVRDEVADRLQRTRAVLAVQVLWQERTTDETLDLLSPLWTWLVDNRVGLIQADGEGFYEDDELILPLE